MKYKKEKEIRWDPIVIRLQEKKGKREFVNLKNEQHNISTIEEEAPFSNVRRSKKEFEKYLKSLFEKDLLRVKYRNPDAWIAHNHKGKEDNR